MQRQRREIQDDIIVIDNRALNNNIKKRNKEKDKPLFTREDIKRAKEPMFAFFISLCCDLGITENELQQRVREYHRVVHGKAPKACLSAGSNELIILKNSTEITLRRLNTLIRNVLRLRVKKISMTFVNDEGQEKEYTANLID